MRTPSPQFRMADRLAKGNLATEITNYRAEGLSLDAIARRLYADHGIEVTRQTVASWAAMEPAEAAS